MQRKLWIRKESAYQNYKLCEVIGSCSALCKDDVGRGRRGERQQQEHFALRLHVSNRTNLIEQSPLSIDNIYALSNNQTS